MSPNSVYSTEDNLENANATPYDIEQRDDTQPDSSPEARSKKEDLWHGCSKSVWKNDKEEISACKEEIDAFLTFAGLFSAVVSVYSVDEYQSLKSDTVDASQLILMRISTQLESLAANSGTRDLIAPISTIPVYSELSTSASFNSRVVNILWFSALMLALSAAAIGILVRQWLNYHVGHMTNTPYQSVRIWHFRHRGLVKWQVREIIALLPILLQVALALFLAGMVIKLWPIDEVVANVLAAQLIALSAFYVFTMFIPLIYARCPYKSPQGWLPIWVIVTSDTLCSVAFGFIGKALRTILPIPTPSSQSIRPSWISRLPLPKLSHFRWRLPGHDLVKAVQMARYHSPGWVVFERENLGDNTVTQLAEVIVDADAIFMDDYFIINVVLRTIKSWEEEEDRRFYRVCEGILENRRCWPRELEELPRFRAALDNLGASNLRAIHLTLLDMFERLMKHGVPQSKEDKRKTYYIFYTLHQTMHLLRSNLNLGHRHSRSIEGEISAYKRIVKVMKEHDNASKGRLSLPGTAASTGEQLSASHVSSHNESPDTFPQSFWKYMNDALNPNQILIADSVPALDAQEIYDALAAFKAIHPRGPESAEALLRYCALILRLSYMSPSIREVDDAVDEVIGLLKDQHRKKLQEKGLTLRSLITDFLTLCTQHKRKQKFEHGVTRGTISGGKTFDEWIKEIEKGTKSWGDELRDHASRMADDILRGADSADRNRLYWLCVELSQCSVDLRGKVALEYDKGTRFFVLMASDASYAARKLKLQ